MYSCLIAVLFLKLFLSTIYPMLFVCAIPHFSFSLCWSYLIRLPSCFFPRHFYCDARVFNLFHLFVLRLLYVYFIFSFAYYCRTSVLFLLFSLRSILWYSFASPLLFFSLCWSYLTRLLHRFSSPHVTFIHLFSNLFYLCLLRFLYC